MSKRSRPGEYNNSSASSNASITGNPNPKLSEMPEFSDESVDTIRREIEETLLDEDTKLSPASHAAEMGTSVDSIITILERFITRINKLKEKTTDKNIRTQLASLASFCEAYKNGSLSDENIEYKKRVIAKMLAGAKTVEEAEKNIADEDMYGTPAKKPRIGGYRKSRKGRKSRKSRKSRKQRKQQKTQKRSMR